MIERTMVYVVEYLANALWQLPLLAAGAWWLLKVARLGPLSQHRVWLVVLGLGVLLPLARVAPQVVVVRTVAVKAGGDEVGILPTVKAPGNLRVTWLREVLRRRSVEVSRGVARGLAGVYLAMVLLGASRLMLGWRAGRRLVAEAADVSQGDGLGGLLEECGRRIGVALPRVVESGEVLSPAMVGRVLVLPETFAGHSVDESRAALLHELAHLRRRDYGANILCEMVGLPVVWHPVSYAVRGRIKSTREMVCDEIAAEAMGSARAYALSLLGLAAKACVGDVEAQPMAVGLFTNNNLEERVMRLIETRETLNVRANTVRLMSATAGMMAVAMLAAMVHVTPAQAQQTTAGGARPAAGAVGDHVPVPPAVPAIADVPAPPPPAAPALPTPPDAPQPPPAPAPVPAPTPVPDSMSLDVVPLADEPMAIAHGAKATVQAKHGTFQHDWTGSDGKPFKVVTHQREEPTAAQKKQYEETFRRQMTEMEKELARFKASEPEMKRQMVAAQRGAEAALAETQSAEFQKQMAELQSPAFKRQIAEQMLRAQRQMDASKEERMAAIVQMKQMKGLDSAEMQKMLADVQKQLAETRLDATKTRVDMKQLDGAEMKRRMADLDRQAETLASRQMEEQMNEELKNSQKQIHDAQKLMERDGLQGDDRPATTCSRNCPALPH